MSKMKVNESELLIGLPHLLEHFAKDTFFVRHERLWGVKLRGLTFVHDENFVAADDGIEAVSDAENSCA